MEDSDLCKIRPLSFLPLSDLPTLFSLHSLCSPFSVPNLLISIRPNHETLLFYLPDLPLESDRTTADSLQLVSD